MTRPDPPTEAGYREEAVIFGGNALDGATLILTRPDQHVAQLVEYGCSWVFLSTTRRDGAGRRIFEVGACVPRRHHLAGGGA
jgi:hypothetical protein